MTLRLLSEAEDEARDAAQWYEDRQAGLGDRFLAALAKGMDKIERGPRRHRQVAQAPEGREVRRVLLDRFPYAVVFEVRAEELLVVAVAHTKRRPGYWRDRIDE